MDWGLPTLAGLGLASRSTMVEAPARSQCNGKEESGETASVVRREEEQWEGGSSHGEQVEHFNDNWKRILEQVLDSKKDSGWGLKTKGCYHCQVTPWLLFFLRKEENSE